MSQIEISSIAQQETMEIDISEFFTDGVKRSVTIRHFTHRERNELVQMQAENMEVDEEGHVKMHGVGDTHRLWLKKMLYGVQGQDKWSEDFIEALDKANSGLTSKIYRAIDEFNAPLFRRMRESSEQ